MSHSTSAATAYSRICDAALADQPWLVTASRTFTFRHLRERIEKMAGFVTVRSVSAGDRVVVATRDDGEAALNFIALMCCGITVINLDPDSGPERARSLIELAAPKLILVDTEVKVRWQLSDAGQLVEISAALPRTGGVLGKLLSRSTPKSTEGLLAELDAQPSSTPPSEVDPESIAYILFTSGSTSQPKGVCISHRALFAHLATLSRRYDYGSDSRILNTLMLAHADGMIQGPVMAFYNAIPLYRPLRFEVTSIDALLDAVYRLRITHMIAVPTMLSLILRLGEDQRDAYQGGDFKLLVSCGAQLEARLWEQFEAAFRVPLVNVYGLTETVVGGVFSGPDAATRLPGGIGIPVDCELRIDAETGELSMRGDLLMSGYFGSPERTAAVLSDDGWFRTGDVAERDEAGRYSIRGRLKDIIIRGGYNIHPDEIVEVLLRDPAVREAFVLGMPDQTWGETVVAVVVTDDDKDSAELFAYCAQHLEPRKVPSRIERVAELPRGLSGKVQIDAIRKLLSSIDRPKGDAVAPLDAGSRDRQVERLLDVAAEAFHADRQRIRITMTPADIPGWDSLSHLELVCAIEEEFSIKLSARDIMALDRLDKALPMLPDDS